MISKSDLLEFVKEKRGDKRGLHTVGDFLDNGVTNIGASDASNPHEQRMRLLVAAAYALAFQAIEEEKFANEREGQERERAYCSMRYSREST